MTPTFGQVWDPGVGTGSAQLGDWWKCADLGLDQLAAWQAIMATDPSDQEQLTTEQVAEAESPDSASLAIRLSLGKPMVTQRTIKIYEGGRSWEFGGVLRWADDYDNDPLAHVDDLEAVPSTDLKAAFRRFAAITGEIAVLNVVTDTAPGDLEFLTRSAVSFRVDGSELVMDLNLWPPAPDSDEVGTGAAARIETLLKRKRLWLISATEDWSDDGPWWNVQITIGFHTRGRALASLVRDGLEVEALVNAVAGSLTRSHVRDLLRGGFAASLIGQQEGHWLEAKQQHYDLDRGEAGQLKLARAVAQFANTVDGGMVVIGLATSKSRGGVDEISRVTPVVCGPDVRRQYLQTLQNKIYPMPDGLVVESVPAGKGELLVIDIPPQLEELKPYLVNGAVVDGRVVNTYLTVVHRRDDEGRADTIASIHAALSVGRAFLRHGKLPG
jgi:hypothetical protein